VKAWVDASPGEACVVFEDGRWFSASLPGCNTNNEAEYKAVIFGLLKAKELGVELDEVFSDSQLVVRQLNGEYKVREKRLERFVEAIWVETEAKYQRVGKLLRLKQQGRIKFSWVPREENRAGRLLE